MITLFFINLLIIWGLHFSFQAGNVFAWFPEWYLKLTIKLSFLSWFEKPLYGCRMCMSSIWSIPVYAWAVYEWDWSLWYWPVWVLCLTGASYILSD